MSEIVASIVAVTVPQQTFIGGQDELLTSDVMQDGTWEQGWRYQVRHSKDLILPSDRGGFLNQ